MSEIKRVVIALGYFDSVHIGHVKVIKKAVETAKRLDVSPAVFTFKGNLKKAVKNSDGKYVYTYNERREIINALGVNEIFFAPTDKEFLSKSKTEFLEYINSVYKISGYVCGKDYKFGYDGGTVDDLKEYAELNGQTLCVLDTECIGKEKVSTTLIKEYLIKGEIKNANALLSAPLFIGGTVIKDRGEGKKIGFPTANLEIDLERANLKDGVYFGFTEIDGKRYKALINYGDRPSFNVDKKMIEAHILSFDKDIYGKEIRIYFIEYIREIKKFSSLEELKEQIEKDVKYVTEKDYD